MSPDPVRRAFTLLEVLMATALLGFGIMTMVGVYVSGLRLLSEGRDLTAATDLARAEILSIEQYGYTYIPDSSSYDGRQPDAPSGHYPPGPYPTANQNGQKFSLVVTSSRKDTNLKSVVVECYWGLPAMSLCRPWWPPECGAPPCWKCWRDSRF